MRSSSSMRRKEGTAFAKGKIVARPTPFVQTRKGRRSILVEPASLHAWRNGLLLLGRVHLLVDVRLVLAAGRPDALDDALDDVLVVLLGVVEAVEVADGDTDHEHNNELEHGCGSERGLFLRTPRRNHR